MDGLILPCLESWRAAQAQEGVTWPDDLLTHTANTPIPAVAGTTQRYAVLTFPDAAIAYAYRSFRLPADLYVPGGMTLRLLWSTPATTGSTQWTAETAFVGVDEDLDPAFNAPTEATAAAAGASADTLQVTEIALDVTGADPGDLMHLRIGRDATDSDDDLVDDVHLIGVELEYQRLVVLP